MNRQRGMKWFIFYTKVRPWIGCVMAIRTVASFVEQAAVYLSYWWLLLSIITSLTAVVLGILVYHKSRGDYAQFVRFVKPVLLFETFDMTYQQGVMQYVDNGFQIGPALIMAAIFFVVFFLLWYCLNVKYFEKRIGGM